MGSALDKSMTVISGWRVFKPLILLYADTESNLVISAIL